MMHVPRPTLGEAVVSSEAGPRTWDRVYGKVPQGAPSASPPGSGSLPLLRHCRNFSAFTFILPFNDKQPLPLKSLGNASQILFIFKSTGSDHTVEAPVQVSGVIWLMTLTVLLLKNVTPSSTQHVLQDSLYPAKQKQFKQSEGRPAGSVGGAGDSGGAASLSPTLGVETTWKQNL